MSGVGQFVEHHAASCVDFGTWRPLGEDSSELLCGPVFFEEEGRPPFEVVQGKVRVV